MKIDMIEDYVDLGFHDDLLTDIHLSLATLEIIFTIQTYTYHPCPSSEIPPFFAEIAPNQVIYQNKKAKIVELSLKLQSTTDFFQARLSHVIPTDIIDCGIDKADFHLHLVDGDFNCKINSYEIKSKM